MSVFMVMVIGFAVIDAGHSFSSKLISPPMLTPDVSDILDVFAAALAVQNAIEIFMNVTLCLTADVIPMKLVVAAGLMAAARNVIILASASPSVSRTGGSGVASILVAAFTA